LWQSTPCRQPAPRGPGFRLLGFPAKGRQERPGTSQIEGKIWRKGEPGASHPIQCEPVRQFVKRHHLLLANRNVANRPILLTQKEGGDSLHGGHRGQGTQIGEAEHLEHAIYKKKLKKLKKNQTGIGNHKKKKKKRKKKNKKEKKKKKGMKKRKKKKVI